MYVKHAGLYINAALIKCKKASVPGEWGGPQCSPLWSGVGLDVPPQPSSEVRQRGAEAPAARAACGLPWPLPVC